MAAIHIDKHSTSTSTVRVEFLLVRVVSAKALLFLATPRSKHLVLLIYTAYSKDMIQFWYQQLHTTLPAIVE